jgi:hypothetical protein
MLSLYNLHSDLREPSTLSQLVVHRESGDVINPELAHGQGTSYPSLLPVSCAHCLHCLHYDICLRPQGTQDNV